MHFFQYPYVIITVLVICFIIMGVIGLYFTIKSARTVNGTVGKGFSNLGALSSVYDNARKARYNRCVVYISVSLDSVKRLYSESAIIRMYDQISKILFQNFCVKTNSEISKYGKQNFVVLNSLDSDEIATEIENCFDMINSVLIEHNAVNIARINFGYHCTSSTEVTFKMALSRAKQACSMAEDKEKLHCEWNSGDGKEFERKIKIENNIQNEIENNRFFLEYQPIIDAKTNKIIGAEVLSRLHSTTDGILTPNSFLSAVNNVGLNNKFDYYIFEKNCKWISNDKENRSKYIYTINFSRCTFCDQDFAIKIIDIVEKYGCDYSNIAIEILEDKNLNEEEKNIMISNLIRLKDKGMKILLDDFGKGYTSFGDLAEFKINIVKVDKSITQNAITNTGFVILKNIINTSHDLGMLTLCEGIETEEQKHIAVEAGCDILQGYYFYHPMPVTQLESLFNDQ